MPTTPSIESSELHQELREMRAEQRVMEARFNARTNEMASVLASTHARLNEMAGAMMNMEGLLKRAVSSQSLPSGHPNPSNAPNLGRNTTATIATEGDRAEVVHAELSALTQQPQGSPAPGGESSIGYGTHDA